MDVLLLLDDAAPMGCIVRVRAVGAIEAEQREDGGAWVRNDRLSSSVRRLRLDDLALGDRRLDDGPAIHFSPSLGRQSEGRRLGFLQRNRGQGDIAVARFDREPTDAGRISSRDRAGRI